jgi:hypothetical protein
MPSAFGSQRGARRASSRATPQKPAPGSTYSAVRHGVVLSHATVAPGQSHDVAWSAANIVWDDSAGALSAATGRRAAPSGLAELPAAKEYGDKYMVDAYPPDAPGRATPAPSHSAER